MALFKRHHLRKVLAGQKTQTRRCHQHTLKIGRTYGIRDRYFTKAENHIIITRKFRQRLGDISPEDIKKEGFSTLEEFKQAWTEINGDWNPDEVVTCYEFKLTS